MRTSWPALIEAFHAAHLRTFGYNYAGQQKIELVNFCVSGFGMIERPRTAEARGRVPARCRRAKAMRPVYFDGAFRDTPVYDRAALPPGMRLDRPGGGRGVRLDHRRLSRQACSQSIRTASWSSAPSRTPRRSRHEPIHDTRCAHPWPTRAASAAPAVDPIVLQIVEGTLNSIEAEIEYAIERTARSPMIREAHDYRVGLFDRYCRKLTGRSYSAMPNAVVRDFPPRDHAAGRRVPDERHLSHRRQHRPPARPVQHRAGVP